MLHFHEHKNLSKNRFFATNEGGAKNRRRFDCLTPWPRGWNVFVPPLISTPVFKGLREMIPKFFEWFFIKSNSFGQWWKFWKTIKESYKIQVLFKDRTKRYVIRGDPEGKSRCSRCDLIKLKRVSNLHPLSSRSSYFKNKIMSED